MLNKLYEEIKRIIKEDYKFFLTLIITFIVCTIEFPYYIEAPGGIINIDDRFEIENSYDSEGSLNMAYVSEYKATIPTILISKIKKDWKLIKRDVDNKNTTTEADYFRNHILLKEANLNAIEVAYKAANISVAKDNIKLYVTYVYEEANTDIQIEDQILEINGKKITSKTDLKNTLENLSINEDINILVSNNDKKYNRKARFVKYGDNYILGVAISEICDIKVTPEIKFNFKDSESGPSGGLMMSLAIYNALTEEDITKGKKIVGTGTIDVDGNVGEIDGAEYKLKGAVKENADIFIVPNGKNYEDAIKLKEKEKYDIEIIKVNTFEEALMYLKNN